MCLKIALSAAKLVSEFYNNSSISDFNIPENTDLETKLADICHTASIIRNAQGTGTTYMPHKRQVLQIRQHHHKRNNPAHIPRSSNSIQHQALQVHSRRPKSNANCGQRSTVLMEIFVAPAMATQRGTRNDGRGETATRGTTSARTTTTGTRTVVARTGGGGPWRGRSTVQ